MPLDEVRGAAKNPKRHAADRIQRSLRRHGAGEAPMLDERTGRLVAGHGRVEALRAMRKQGDDPPEGVEVDEDGRWLVPVQRGWSSEDDAQAEAYLLASNTLSELGGWDDEEHDAMVARLLEEDRAILERVIKEEPALPVGDPDDVPEPPAEADCYVEPGSLWQLGDHRIICGDCTDEGTVARLLGGVVPFLMVTDPPYGVEYKPGWRNEAAVAGYFAYARRRVGEVPGDGRADWSAAWALFGGSVAYVWHAGRRASEVQKTLETSNFEIRNQVIWRKPQFVISRGAYHWQHEPCWYAVRKGSTARWCGGRSQTTVWDISNVLTEAEGKTNHSTQKPVECMARPMRNHDEGGGMVYDPFVGSGTTIIAAEQDGRRCFAVELSPPYVQVAISRREGYTGRKAERLEG